MLGEPGCIAMVFAVGNGDLHQSIASGTPSFASHDIHVTDYPFDSAIRAGHGF